MPFTPYPNQTRTLVAKTSATTTSLNFNPQSNPNISVRLYCTTNTVYYNFGVGATTATVSSCPLPPGVIEIIDVGAADTLAVYNLVGSSHVYITPGFGSES